MPLDNSRAISYVVIEVPEATTPQALHGILDFRTLGVALHSVDLKIHSINPKYAYPMIVSNKEPSVALINALGTGWYDLEKDYVWSEADSLLKLPVPKVCKSGACSAVLTLKAYGAHEDRPVKVLF